MPGAVMRFAARHEKTTKASRRGSGNTIDPGLGYLLVGLLGPITVWTPGRD